MMARMAIDADDAGERVQFVADHLRERFAVAAHGGKEDDEILHGAAEDDADEDPEGAGQVAELRGEDRADERPGAGDGGEVMAEDDPFVGLHEVLAVLVDFAGRGAPVVEREHVGGDPFGIEAVADGVGAERGDEDEAGVQRLAALRGDDRSRRTRRGERRRARGGGRGTFSRRVCRCRAGKFQS